MSADQPDAAPGETCRLCASGELCPHDYVDLPRPQPDAATGETCGKLIVTEPCQRVRGHAGPHFASTKGVNPALVYERSRPGAPDEAEQLDRAVTDAYLALLEGKTDAAIGTLAVAMGIRDQPPAPPGAPAQPDAAQGEPKVTVYLVTPADDMCRLMHRTLDEAFETVRLNFAEGEDRFIIERAERTEAELAALEEWQGW